MLSAKGGRPAAAATTYHYLLHFLLTPLLLPSILLSRTTMKLPLSAVMVAIIVPSVAITTEAATMSVMYGYCMGCTEWKGHHVKEKDNFFPPAAKTAPSAALVRSNFIPWPTTATFRLMSPTPAAVPVSKEKNMMKADSMPLVTTKRLVSPNPTYQEEKLLDSASSNQQLEEESLLLLCFLVAVAAAYVVMTTSYASNDDKLSSDFNMLELAPTIDDEDEQDEVRNMETKSRSILVGSFSSEGKCVVNKQKAEKRVQFQDVPQQEEDFKSERQTFFSPKEEEGFTVPTPFDDCKSSMPFCFDSFQDMVSNKILKSLLEDPVEKCDISAPSEKLEEEHQDIVKNSSSMPKANESNEEENSCADLNMIREYEDFLFQVSHSLY